VVVLPPALEAVELGKSFGSLRALDGVSLRVAPGTVHALLGENGAGKSTLVKCVMGYHRPDGGRILLDGAQVTRAQPAPGAGAGHRHGVPALHPGAEHDRGGEPGLAAGHLPFAIDWAKERERWRASWRMPFHVPLDAPVRTLAAGEKQKLEILKQLYLEQPDRHPRRADVGADARRGRRGAGPAARMTREARSAS
jgi:simple sugar transport system ATP-binding protein